MYAISARKVPGSSPGHHFLLFNQNFVSCDRMAKWPKPVIFRLAKHQLSQVSFGIVFNDDSNLLLVNTTVRVRTSSRIKLSGFDIPLFPFGILFSEKTLSQLNLLSAFKTFFGTLPLTEYIGFHRLITARFQIGTKNLNFVSLSK